MLWYALQTEKTDFWDDGYFDREQAIEALKEQGHGLIAVIDGDVCVEEIMYEDVAE